MNGVEMILKNKHHYHCSDKRKTYSDPKCSLSALEFKCGKPLSLEMTALTEYWYGPQS